MAVSLANAECKDLLQIEEAADDVLPLFVVNRFDIAPVVCIFSIFRFGSIGEATSGQPVDETGNEGNRKKTF